jgi:ribonuclease P protein component
VKQDGTAPGACRLRLPSGARLHSAREFRRVYQRGRRAVGNLFTVVGFFARDGKGTRLGLSVSKDHGCAVRRNKIKRLLREAFRLERQQLPANLDLVLIPRVHERKLQLPQLRRELLQLVEQLGRTPERPRRRRPQP